MTYILLDESGDLGFSFDKGSSRYFVMTAIITDNKRQLEKIVRTVRSKLDSKHRKFDTLHAHRDEHITRQRLLRKLGKTECQIIAVVLNKKKVYRDAKTRKSTIYNDVTRFLINRIFEKHPWVSDVWPSIIASRREMNVFLNKEFKHRVTEDLKVGHRNDIEISIATPANEKSLQIVDYVSWAVYQSLEKGDDDYLKIIKPLLIEIVMFIHK
jgi:hypothetical protein